jgi:hypothetical protein
VAHFPLITSRFLKILGRGHPMNALLTAVMLWLSANFDLPPIYSNPNIEFVSLTKIAALRSKGVLSNEPKDITSTKDNVSAPSNQREVVAVYDSEMKTIYLPEGWTGSTPAELSVLVHEMVHHLQNLSRSKFECPQAREKLAYAAQERWLGLFGRNLLVEFEIDPFTLLVTTGCVY